MSRDLVGQGKKIAKKGLFFQGVTALILILAGVVFSNAHTALSLACGAVISILPTLIFAGFAFRYAGARQSNLVARSFSQGAKIKLALTMILFVVAFMGLQASPLPVIIGYVITTVSYWLALFRDNTQQSE